MLAILGSCPTGMIAGLLWSLVPAGTSGGATGASASESERENASAAGVSRMDVEEDEFDEVR